VIGSDRTLTPVAWWTAFAIAAATPTRPTSPIPFVPMGVPRSGSPTKVTSIYGMSACTGTT